MKSNIISELKRIAKKHGGILSAETVVEYATPESSPLHSRFEWDDSVAGQCYRLWQARQLIKISVEVMAENGETMDVFVSLTPDRKEGSGYRILTDVLSDSQMREQLLSDALDDLDVFRDKYKKLKELSIIFEAIKSISVSKARQERMVMTQIGEHRK